MIENLHGKHSPRPYDKTIRDFRDILLGNIASAQDLTIHKGYAEVDAAKCIACGRCLMIGHCEAIRAGNGSDPGKPASGKVHIEIEKCLACSTCVDVCPQRAISMKENN